MVWLFDNVTQAFCELILLIAIVQVMTKQSLWCILESVQLHFIVLVSFIFEFGTCICQADLGFWYTGDVDIEKAHEVVDWLHFQIIRLTINQK